MKLGHESDEIAYVTDLGTVSVYQVTLENRPVMRVTADRNDPNRGIRIAKADGTGVQLTKGQFTLTDVDPDGPMTMVMGEDGVPEGFVPAPGNGRVSEKSVYTYVLPRLHLLIARLFVSADQT